MANEETEVSSGEALQESGLDSIFDPDVSIVAQKKPEEKPVEPTPRKRSVKSVEPKGDKNYLQLTEGYKIKLKPDSGYRAFLRIMAKEGHFEEVVRILENPSINLSDPVQAKQLLDLAMVRRDAVEHMLSNDSQWTDHCTVRLANLQKRALAGNDKAKNTLSNPKRVKDGKWVGDIKEIISTCCGAWKNKNNNVLKFDACGITFRKYPLSPKQDQPVYLLMFPSKHVTKIVQAIKTVHEVDEEIPQKYV